MSSNIIEKMINDLVKNKFLHDWAPTDEEFIKSEIKIWELMAKNKLDSIEVQLYSEYCTKLRFHCNWSASKILELHKTFSVTFEDLDCY
jgi:hypothetical protein